MELGGPCIPSLSLSFILFSKYLLSACHVPGPVLGLEYNGVQLTVLGVTFRLSLEKGDGNGSGKIGAGG